MLKLKNISFAYSNQEVLTNISFTVGKGENVAIVGESGSGKSTLLSAIYGRFDLKKGDISWNDTEILGPAYNLVVGYDFIKYVSQEFDLMPFTTVGENVGKYLSNFYPKSKKNRTDELIAVVGLEDFTNTKVKNLSGGQKQRVALARALANEPELLLMDEPFSDIDNFKKNGLRRKLFSYLKNNKISCLVATHDKEDVLGFADKMLVLHKGKVMANDTPNHLFENPESPLVASFFAEYNILPDRLVESKNSNLVYAHELEVVAESGFEVKVKNSYYKGTKYLIEGLFENRSIFFYHNLAFEEGDKVSLKISRKRPQ